MEIRTVTTHDGHTATDILNTACVSAMQAGTYEITTDLLPGYILSLTDVGTMVLAHSGGAVCEMDLADDGLDRLTALHDACEESYATGAAVQP